MAGVSTEFSFDSVIRGQHNLFGPVLEPPAFNFDSPQCAILLADNSHFPSILARVRSFLSVRRETPAE